MRGFFRDTRYAARTLWRSRGFAATATLALALGIGAATAIFSLVDGVVLRPLPYPDPERLVTIWDRHRARGLEHEPFSPVTFLDYRALARVFSDAAAWWRPEVTLQDPAREAVRVNTVEVSGNFTAVIGVAPALGAGFPQGVLHSRERMVLISHRLWQTRFAGDPSIVGRFLRLNDDPFAVAGVMPPGFTFPDDTDVWQRLNWDLAQHNRGARFMEAVVRLQPGVTVADAQREVDALTRRLAVEFPRTNEGWDARVVALHDEVVGSVRPALLVLLASVGLLLLIACLNVATLLLARAAVRTREVAVRAAIGASRTRLVAQFLTESLLLAAAGTLGGVLIAAGAIRLVAAWSPLEIPRLAQVSVDLRVLAFAIGLTALTAVACGLLPALLLARTSARQTLKEGARGQGGSPGRRRAHRLLVVAEVALAVTLLAAAGLLLRSVRSLTAGDPGFHPDGIVTSGVQLTGAAYSRWTHVEAFHSRLVDLVRAQPGIAAAGATNFLPLAPGWRIPFLVEGAPAPPEGAEPTAQYHSVSDGYFETLGVPLLRGRLFDARDTARSRGVVIVNDAFARRYFPGQDPVGRTVRSLTTNIGPLGASLMADRNHLVVGVVGDVKNSSLDGLAEPSLFHTSRQFPFRHMYVVARGTAAGSEAQVAAAIRDSVRQADRGLPQADLRPMSAVIGAAVERPRFLMQVMGGFACAALALAALGIYGLMAYGVTERRQELSIRLALGAAPAGILWMVLRQGLALGLAGSIAGVALAAVLGRSARATLPGVSSTDSTTLAVVMAVAVLVAVAAGAAPAWRAARLNPLAGLRE